MKVHWIQAIVVYALLMGIIACNLPPAGGTPAATPTPQDVQSEELTPASTDVGSPAGAVTPSQAASPVPEESPAPQNTPGVPQGTIQFESIYGDAGNFSMIAGSKNFMVWENFPPGAERYDFVILNYQNSGENEIIGTDVDPSDGITTDWLVAEHVSGTLVGFASFADGSVIQSEYAGDVYSNEAPPEGVCSVQSSTIGVVPIYAAPTSEIPPPTSAQIGEFTPGVYAIVLGRQGDAWVQIDMASAYEDRSEPPPGSVGWVWAGSTILYHGSCDTVPEISP